MSEQQVHNVAPDLVGLLRPIDEVEPWAENPNDGDVEAVMASYQQFGQRKPVQVQRVPESGVLAVMDGNTQWHAAQRLGWTHMAMTGLEDMSWPESVAYGLAANQTARLASMDTDAEDELIRFVAGEDAGLVSSLGFDEERVGALLDVLPELDGVELDDVEFDEDDIVPVTESLDVVVTCSSSVEAAELVDELLGRGLKVRRSR